MKILMLKFYLAVFLTALFCTNVLAQGWYQTYPDLHPYFYLGLDYPDLFNDIDPTSDGGYLISGVNYPEESIIIQFFLTKVDLNGNIQWHKDYPIFFDSPESNNDPLASYQNFFIEPTSDGGYMGIGNNIGENFDWQNPSVQLVKFDAFGDTLWTKYYEPDVDSLLSINQFQSTPDGGFVVLGKKSYPGGIQTDFLLTKLDQAGNIMWQNPYEFYTHATSSEIAVSDNGHIAFAGYFSNDPNIYMYVWDENGNQIWNEEEIFSEDQVFLQDAARVEAIDFHNSGDLLLAVNLYGNGGTSYSKMARWNIENDELVWRVEHNADTPNIGYIQKMCALPNGNIGTIGLSPTTDTDQSSLIKILDENANLIFVGNSLPFDGIKDLVCKDNNSMVSSGVFYDENNNQLVPFATQIGENGTIFSSQISGYIYQDANENCDLEDGENGLEGQIVELSPTGFYTVTDSSGFYQFDVNEGVYTINSYIPQNDPWNLWDYTCIDTFLNVVVADYDTLVNENIGLNPIIECPILEVNVGVNLLRRCFENNVFINYENVGTDDAENAYIAVELDEAILLDSASVDYTLEDGLYLFYLGDVAMWENGQIQLVVTVNCEAELGSTSCIQANAYPNDFCGEISQLWDGSNIEVGATCEGDSIEFYLRNNGDDMAEIRYYTIYEDDLLQGIEPFDLDMNETRYFKVATTGATYRVEAEQSDYFPGLSMPQVIVEMCSDEASDDFSMGFVTSTPSDDLDPFVDIECHEIIGSFDPNDKLVSPKGIGENHYINSEEMLDYTIRFQNTGNDTAFNIFVIDTLSHFLDINSFVSGVSSHDYTISFTGDRVVRWDFSNILLPDSTTNLVESNGFVKFKIKVATDVPQETEIHNIADIYFDFNEPIRTPDIFVTVCDDCVDQHRTRYLNAKVFLEGAYNNSNAMNANLGELIPLVQPYRNMPYIYYGNEELSEIPNEMVDWVLVEARLGEPAIFGQRNTTTTETRAALLMSDGSIRDLDGISPVAFHYLIHDNEYYFCIRHRNHLDVLSASPLELEDEMFFDFTTDINQAFGSQQMKWSEDGKALLHVGDYNQDGVIQTTDYDLWVQDPAELNAYENTDGTLDGVIQLTDFDEWRKNKAKIGSVEIGF